MAECQVFRDSQGNIERVTAPNGSESILYDTILKSTPDKEMALREWAKVYTKAFKEKFGDWETYFYSESGGGGKFTPTKEVYVDRSNMTKNTMIKSPDGKYYFVNDIRSKEPDGEDYLAASEDGMLENGMFEDHYNAPTLYDLGPVNIRKDNIFEDISEEESPLFDARIQNLKGWTVVGTYKFDKDLYRSTTAKLFRGKLDENGEPHYEYLKDSNQKLLEQSPKDLLNQAKEYKNDIKGLYKEFVNDSNLEQALFEVAIQTHSSSSEAETALKIFGPKLISIAEKLFPNAKVGDNFKSKIDNLSFAKQQYSVIGPLQAKGLVGKRVATNTFEVSIDPANFNLIDQQIKATKIAEQLNKAAGKEVVTTKIVNGNAAIMVDPNIKAIVDKLDPSDFTAYKKYLVDNLYTNKDNPATSELINNAAKLAKELGRDDLVNVARLIYKYLDKNPTLKTRVVDDIFEETGNPGMRAYYNKGSNSITFGRSAMGTATLEYEAETTLHEILHGLTFQPWLKTQVNIQLSQEEKDFKHVVETYYNYFKGKRGAEGYAFTNPEEFLMGALFDKPFQDHLKQISEVNDKGTSFTQFLKDLVKRFLGLFGIKANDSIVDKLDPEKVQSSMIDALSDYLGKMKKIDLFNGLKEEGRNYGLSFAITAQQDYLSESEKLKAERLEREKMKSPAGNDLRAQLKKSVDKSILSIKSFGSSIRKRIPESQEGFKAIFKQLKKLEDPAYSLDQIDFFFDFTSEIQAIMNVAYDKIRKLQADQTINDPDVKLKEYEDIVSAVRNFDPILSEIQNIKIQLEGLGYKASLLDLDDISTKRDRVESIYSMGVFPLVTDKFVDILSPASRTAIDIAQTRIEELDKRIALAGKNNNKARVLQLTQEKNKEQTLIDKNLTLNSDKVQDWLRGQMGDSNILQVWLMAGVSNSNPIVSGLSKYLRDNVGEAAPKVLELMNTMQANLESYAENSGRSYNDIFKFNSPLIQTHKVIDGKDENGYTYKDKHSLLHEFNGGHIQELQKFKRDLTELFSKKRELESTNIVDPTNLKALEDIIKTKKNEQRQFVKDYMEQQYAPEVHDALDMLHEDLGGYSAWDYMGPVISRIEDTELAIEQESDEGRLSDLYKQLDDHNVELSRLGSLYEKSPDSRELKVAEQLRKRRELLGKYSTYNLTDKGKLQFDTQWARMLRKLSKGEVTIEKYERWLEDNTVTENTPEYWEEKQRILKSLNDLYAKMGATNKKDDTIGKLYKDMEDITKAHRDSNGIIDGSSMPLKEQLDVKKLEEQIEEAKDNIANIFGITRGERIKQSNLRSQVDEINSMIFFEKDPNSRANMQAIKDDLQDEIDEITSKKKNINKKLIDDYFKLMKELGELDESNVTKYYLDESQERLEQEIAKVDTTSIPSKLFLSGKTYQKAGTEWLEISGSGIKKVDAGFVESLFKESRGTINFNNSDWYKNNHITKMKFVRNENYVSGSQEESPGDYEEVTEPTYAWKQTRPKDPKYVKNNQPSIKYKTRTIKDQYINKNYKEDINGDLRPKIRGAKDDRFINKDYQRLVNSGNSIDQATANMLKFLTDTYFKAQEGIPKGLRPGYELPSIRKSETERLTGQNLKRTSQDMFEYLGQLARGIKDQTTVNEQDKDILYGYNDDFNGVVPIKFLGNIDSKDLSIDLPKSILTFASEMVKREQLVKSLPFANAVKDIVNNIDNRPVKTKKGVVESMKRKFLPKGTELAKRSESSNTALQVNEIIKSEIYGENMKDQPAAKLVNTSLKLGAGVMLGLNFVSSVQNYANAFTQSIIEAESKNKNFDIKGFFKAQKIYYAHVDELMSDIGKYGNKSYINQFFDYFGGINYKVFGKNHKTLAYSKVGEFTKSLSVPNTITEHMLNYHMGIAIALKYRVADGKGNMVPIFEAFTKKDGQLVQKEGFNVTEKERKEFIAKLNSSARRINGEYGDKILADKYILGKLATFMNRYLIPFVVKRYGSKKFDIQDGIRDEGYWRLFGKILIQDIRTKSLPIVGQWKYYTAQEKQAVVKSMTELGFTVMFSLMISALGGDDPKRIKDNSILTNNMIYALKGIQQQNEAFLPVPGIGFDDLLRKVQNPFPILGKVKNLVSLIQDGSHTAWYEMGLPGVDEKDVKYMQKTGWHNPGDFKMFADFQKLIGVQKLVNYFYPDEALKAQESMSRIK